MKYDDDTFIARLPNGERVNTSSGGGPPGRRAAEQCDELASFQLIEEHSVPY